MLGVVALPFEFEGQRRQRQAQNGLGRLRAVADGVICLHNQKVSRLHNENTRALEIFSAASKLWAEGVRGIIADVDASRPDQRGFCRSCFRLAWPARGEFFCQCRSGGRSTEQGSDRETSDPSIIENGQALKEADALLVNLAGGPDLTMTDVNRVMDQLRRQPENAQLLMSASICEELTGKLRITIIASKYGKADEPKGLTLDIDGLVAEAAAACSEQIDTQFFKTPQVARTSSRFAPPAPDLPDDKKDQMFAEQNGMAGRVRKAAARLRQTQLPLEIISKDRFEKARPTIHRGEDLDVPTYIRRGIKLN